MNYKKYIPEGQTIKYIIHQHWLTVLDSFVLWISFGAILPSFLYYQSERIRDLVPFVAIEGILFFVFLKVAYELFNWYNDVWLITEDAVYDVEWSLLKTRVESIHHENIEGVEIDKHRIWDNIFNKGDIIIHKFGEEELAIYNAFAPYKATHILEEYIQGDIEEDTSEMDRFDMIMDALSGVVADHLERHGSGDGLKLHQSENHSKHKEIQVDEYSLDLREKK